VRVLTGFAHRDGGDTEVDVNDVSLALEKVMDHRRAEDTWQVDSFGGVSAAPTRPPDEVRPARWRITRVPDFFLKAIVLCLDLSESMNGRSGVSRSVAKSAAPEALFDHEAASFEAVDRYVKGISTEVVAKTGKRKFFMSTIGPLIFDITEQPRIT